MDDTDVDFFLETLKNLITSSDLNLTINEKQQLESLEKKIEYLRGFLKVTEKKRNEHSEVMKLVMQIRDVVSEAGNVVREFVVSPVKADAAYSLREHQDYLSLDLERVEKEIKTLTDEVMQIYDQNMYDINGVGITKFKYSSTEIGGTEPAAVERMKTQSRRSKENPVAVHRKKTQSRRVEEGGGEAGEERETCGRNDKIISCS